ncbi:MAG: (2Fe-2S)-binding protein [Clostridia bacterium]|nr:(2Fe-2S)-binding protein [Clostridia bacterium]
MRIEEHPILTFERGKELTFYLDGEEMKGYEGETIQAAIHANKVKLLGYSSELKRPRGFYCAIGNCSSCMMTVDGVANVKTCTTLLKEGMRVETQKDKGVLR